MLDNQEDILKKQSQDNAIKMITSNVKYIMRKKEMTIHQLMELTKLSDHSVLKARTSKIKGLKLETLDKIAKALDCKVKNLFEEE